MPKKRNPVAKAVTRIRPQVIPNKKRSHLLERGNKLLTDELRDNIIGEKDTDDNGS